VAGFSLIIFLLIHVDFGIPKSLSYINLLSISTIVVFFYSAFFRPMYHTLTRRSSFINIAYPMVEIIIKNVFECKDCFKGIRDYLKIGARDLFTIYINRGLLEFLLDNKQNKKDRTFIYLLLLLVFFLVISAVAILRIYIFRNTIYGILAIPFAFVLAFFSIVYGYVLYSVYFKISIPSSNQDATSLCIEALKVFRDGSYILNKTGSDNKINIDESKVKGLEALPYYIAYRLIKLIHSGLNQSEKTKEAIIVGLYSRYRACRPLEDYLINTSKTASDIGTLSNNQDATSKSNKTGSDNKTNMELNECWKAFSLILFDFVLDPIISFIIKELDETEISELGKKIDCSIEIALCELLQRPYPPECKFPIPGVFVL